MNPIETIEKSGYDDGFEAGLTSGTTDTPIDGWDGDLINAIGFSGVCKEFGIAEQDTPDYDEWDEAMQAYVRGCKRGVEDGVKSHTAG